MPGTYPTNYCCHQRQERAKENNKYFESKRIVRYFDKFSSTVNKMTNWQRSQWAKNGYPGFKKKEVELVEPYAMLKR